MYPEITLKCSVVLGTKQIACNDLSAGNQCFPVGFASSPDVSWLSGGAAVCGRVLAADWLRSSAAPPPPP